MTNLKEHRALSSEIRAKGRRLEGYAAVFGQEARIGDGFTESIAPGAFAGSLRAGNDVLALVDHDPSRVLARTRSGTLRLSEDSRGLAFDLDVPDTQAGRDVLALAARGDIGGMSFGFTAMEDRRNGDHRELLAIDLREISVVLAFPAYDGTSVDARSRQINAPFRAFAERALQLMEGAQ